MLEYHSEILIFKDKEMAFQTTIDSIDVDTSIGHHTGCKPDRPDPRDLVKVYGSSNIPSADSHPEVDLRKYVLKVFDQGKKLGCCVASAVCSAYELELNKEAEPHGYYYYHFDPSRLFLYYNSRIVEKATEIDAGASIKDTLDSVHTLGVCRESLWPYKVRKFAVKPPDACYEDALGKTISKYESLKQDINQFRACLKEGNPFVFGFRVYNSFIIKKDGLMPMPSAQEIKSYTEPFGHSVLAVGYNDHTECITVLNSWGESWGDKGYFYMPYKYITDPLQARDFWKIEKANENIEIVIPSNKIDIVIHS